MSSFFDLGIPSSGSTVLVKAIDVGAPSSILPAAFVLEPVLPGYEGLKAPIYTFYIEHGATGKRLMFDLGLRKDPKTSAPVAKQMAALWKTKGFALDYSDKDIFDRLQEGGVDPATIDTVIWSHGHLDHTGEMSKFPASTELVVGPGLDIRTYPTAPESHLFESDFAGRKVTELDLNNFDLTIGDCEALDYFSDGSLYILNSPGHQVGHITALARVTPTSFILLGGDSCHHVGQLRPTADLHTHFPCPGHVLQSFEGHSIAERTTPLLSLPSESSAYADLPTARSTITKLGKLDASPDILVIIAHDATVPGVIDEFPESLNDWKAKGWKDKLTWAFLERESPAFRFS
ncbi:beta-lactamase-like protein [Desarmillaria ectypa]|nr:beta-lactamase-like protein [Desarmillaria ectypa]